MYWNLPLLINPRFFGISSFFRNKKNFFSVLHALNVWFRWKMISSNSSVVRFTVWNVHELLKNLSKIHEPLLLRIPCNQVKDSTSFRDPSHQFKILCHFEFFFSPKILISAKFEAKKSKFWSKFCLKFWAQIHILSQILAKNKILCTMYSWAKIFDTNLDFWHEYWFLTRILIFDTIFCLWHKFWFWDKFWFLTQILILVFDTNFDFETNFYFETYIYFWHKSWFMTQIVIFDRNFDFGTNFDFWQKF